MKDNSIEVNTTDISPCIIIVPPSTTRKFGRMNGEFLMRPRRDEDGGARRRNGKRRKAGEDRCWTRPEEWKQAKPEVNEEPANRERGPCP